MENQTKRSWLPTAFVMLFGISISPTFAQVSDYLGNPAVLGRGYRYILSGPNDPMTRQLTKSDSIELYFKPIEKQKSVEILQIFLPAPSNRMPQIVARTFAVNCEAGSVRFTTMSTFDGLWKATDQPREMLGSKWEIPAANSFGYFAYGFTCPKQ